MVKSAQSIVRSKKHFEMINGQNDYDENMCNFVVNIVSADGLSPDGVRPSADTVVLKCGFASVLGQWFRG